MNFKSFSDSKSQRKVHYYYIVGNKQNVISEIYLFLYLNIYITLFQYYFAKRKIDFTGLYILFIIMCT